MMVHYVEKKLLSQAYNQTIRITPDILSEVAASGIQAGTVTVVTRHTTTGISANEDLECLIADIEAFLGHLVPEDRPYIHARLLRSYGATAGNPTGHLKSLLAGSSVVFPVQNGHVMLGGAQDVFFMEFDGPQQRTYSITVMGE